MTLKRLLAFAVAMAMVMGIVPAMAVTAANDDAAVVAAVANEEYNSLEDAIAAAVAEYENDGAMATVTLLDSTDEDFTLEYGVVKLVTDGFKYTGTATVTDAVLLSDCAIAKVEAELTGVSSDKSMFGYTSIATGATVVEGAQVRIGSGADENGKVTDSDSGLRFIATTEMSDTLAAMAYEFYNTENGEYAEGYEIGIKLQTEGSTDEAFVPATLWQEEGKVFSAALTKLKETNYNRRYTANAYVVIDGVRFEDAAACTRSIYQVSAGLLAKADAAQSAMSQDLVDVLNAYVNQTGVRLVLSDFTKEATLTAATGNVNGAYSGEAVFKVNGTSYKNGVYTVVLEAIGRSVINTKLFNQYVRINNNNSKVAPLTTITDNGNGTYTITFDYADMNKTAGVITEPVTLENGEIVAYIPAGVTFNGSATRLKLLLTAIDDEQSEVEAEEGEDLNAFDIHVSGISEDNTTPIIITLPEVAEKGLNRGNLKLYHVEDGKQVAMEQVDSVEMLTKHNQFTYDPLDGTVTVALASFSEVALVADTEKAWEGKFDYTWYDKDAKELTIANADQLAAFSAIVGGMNGQTQDSFKDKTVKLVSDINLGDKESENDSDKIFYPIGYYNSTGSYEKVSGVSVESSVKSFEGTFDGNGHTIKNFYQNTWEMFGDYNSGYSETPNHYDDAMGLFGYVYNGKVMNLTVDNFSSDGEFTPTGVIAAYAVNSTFEHIALTNCNPRVYNTGNGGIVGIGGNSDDTEDLKLTFTNITIDNTNTISALWGSWDVACGGLVGMFRGDGLVDFTNCHVEAQMDVYNDVCDDNQYYWYRYSGMMIGSIRKNVTGADGYTYPDMTGITASGCTVRFGEWNDYWYCEFVENNIASNTRDYKFSRVDQSELTWVDSNENNKIDANEIKTVKCTHDHTVAGTEIVGGKEVAVENKTAVYLPFDQLFTGYDWDVNSKGLKDVEELGLDIKVLDIKVKDFVEKFETNFTGDFLYRVGNQNTVPLGSLFEAKDGVTVNNSAVYVSIDKVDEESNVSGTYTANTNDWTTGTIKFDNTGVVKVTITDDDYCISTELLLEVVDATNLTSAKGTTTGGDFVLLCDVNASNYVYYWNSTLYGNGFTYSLKGAPTNYSSSHGHGVLMTKNATLDNVVIVGDVYDEYGAYTNNNDYNAAIDVMGETVIQNCYISGCSAPISTRANVTIKDTTLYGGAVGNIILKGGIATLEDVTTANYDDGRALVGMGIVIHSDAAEGTKLILNGVLTQYNFISESKVPNNTYASNLHSTMFGHDCSKYHFGTTPNRYVNAGIVSLTAMFNAEDITDNANTGYVGSPVTVSGVNGYVYTQPSTSGSVNNDYDKDSDPHISTTQGAVPPSYSFDYTTKNYVAKTDGSNDYCYEENGIVYISMDDGDTFNWDTSILTLGKNIKDYTVSMNGIDYTGKSITFNAAGDYEVVYTYTDPNNFKLDESGGITSYEATYTKTVHISVAVIKATTKHAEFTMGSTNAATEKITIDNATYISATGVTADNSTWTYITIDGQKIYYPIIAAKLTSTRGSSTYAYFPVFENVVTITDYADGGTGDALTYNSSTKTLPLTLTAVKGIYKAASDVPYWYNLTNSNLTQSGANKIFKWGSSSDAPSDPETYNNVLCYKSPQISANRVAYITLVQYSYTDEANTTYYYYVGYTLEAFTKQNICVTPDTLVTMADGSQKEIQYVSVGEEVIVWNFYTGEYEVKPVSLLQAHGTGVQNVLHLYFEDGTELKVLGEHGIFDKDLNTFIFIDENDVEEYVGHSFVKQDGDSYNTVKLVGYEVTEEYTTAYTILSYDHYNVLLEDMFTVTPAHVGGNFFNPFEIGEGMKYDEASMQADIEKYGLYTYEDFDHVLTREKFEALNLGHFKVSVGKGLVTYEGLIYLIEEFINRD